MKKLGIKGSVFFKISSRKKYSPELFSVMRHKTGITVYFTSLNFKK